MTEKGTIRELKVSFGKPVGIEGREDFPVDFRDSIYEGIEKLVLEYPVDDLTIRDVDHLPNLSSLTLRHGNNLDIGRLIDLQRLKELNFFFTTVPRSIGDLDELEKLVICQPPEDYSFGSSRIPSGDWPSLRDLHISGVESERLPQNFGGENLRRLRINGAYGESLPKRVWEYAGLDTLDVEGNKLNSVPESVRNLKNLKLLNLRANRIGNIPDAIGELDSLETLDIDCNTRTDQVGVIQKLPYSLGNLRKLKYLFSYANQELRDLPDSLGNLTNLRIYDFKDCPLTDNSRIILEGIDWAKPRVHKSWAIDYYEKLLGKTK